MRKFILSVVGARPQFVKAAVISRLIAAHPEEWQEVLVHTGQHYSDAMSALFFRELKLREADVNLGVGSGSHGVQTARMLEKIEAVIAQHTPQLVLVYGDTNSTLAAALAAAKMFVPIAHVEAGLRSFNRRMPEEINRLVVDQLSSLLFAPSATAVKNLAQEGIGRGVIETGDIMYDTFLFYRGQADESVLKHEGLQPRKFLLATIHRAENTDDPHRLAEVFQGLGLAGSALQMPVILPIHPRTAKDLAAYHLTVPPAVRCLEPVGYLTMLALLKEATAVLTDSGGLQKEAYFSHVPCVTLRAESEWVETLEIKANRLAAGGAQSILEQTLQAISEPTHWPDGIYGDGRTGERMLAEICRFLEH